MSSLFDASKIRVPEGEGPESVGDLTLRIRDTLETKFPDVWVVGEISNLKTGPSGHIFFSLKDAQAAIRCVIWKSAAGRMAREVADGVEVEVRGHIGVFEKQGSYQIYVSSLRPRGVGALEVAFRQLKERLEKEGLFDPARKRPLPKSPRRIGVVTSPTGAVIRDIINILGRRWPAAEIVLAPARVQGEGAAAEIARGIENLNRLGRIDVMIVGRGGGSLEDLWPFNEEIVARAIYASAVPVVSAVGHETDFSISDFVADVRAPTPSAAAELVVPDRREVLASLAAVQTRLARNLKYVLDRLRDDLALFEGSRYFRYPQEIVLGRVQALEDLEGRLLAAVRQTGSGQWLRLERAAAGLARHSPAARHQAAAAALRMAAFRLTRRPGGDPHAPLQGPRRPPGRTPRRPEPRPRAGARLQPHGPRADRPQPHPRRRRAGRRPAEDAPGRGLRREPRDRYRGRAAVQEPRGQAVASPVET